ncbi:cytochrome P-450 cyp509A1 [Helicostylum pulchrum]|nr:cytochrome P-450 cyp509A1 [Helicostylum pulchrum]
MVMSDTIQKVFLSTNYKRGIQYISIGTAIMLALSYACYDIFWLPPRRIRHIPHWKYTNFFIKTFFRKASLQEKIKQSADIRDGLNLRPDRIGWTIHVSSPSGVKTILSKPDVFVKAFNKADNKKTIYERFVGGNNLLLSEGEDYKRLKKTVNPAFRRPVPIQLFGRMTQRTLQEIDQMGGKQVDMTDLCNRLTLDILGKAVFDFNFDATGDPHNEWTHVYKSIMESMSNKLFYYLPFLDQGKWLWLFPKRYQAHQNLTKFLNMLSEMISNKRQTIAANHEEGTRNDLLSLMIDSELNEEVDGLTDEEIMENLCIFFFAGHETTANAVAFIIYNLAKDQERQEQARQEVLHHLGDAPEDILPTLEDAMKLTFINQIMKETMRMYGPVSGISPRITTEDTFIDGAFIPKDTFVSVSIFRLHHNEKVWKSHNEFIPERFSPEGEFDQFTNEGIQWAPFGSGRRQCIGMNFSLFEQRVVLAMLLRKYTWTLPEDSIHKENVVTSGIITVCPKELRINFERRY